MTPFEEEAVRNMLRIRKGSLFSMFVSGALMGYLLCYSLHHAGVTP